MKIGTAEPVTERGELGVSRSRVLSPTGRPGGGGGDDGGHGGDEGNNYPKKFDEANDEQTVPDKAKFVTWFLLVAVLMTFGGMIGAYVVISTSGAAEWRPFDLPVQVWLSTALIIASSVTYQLGKNALFDDRPARSRKMLIATTALGAAFISSQLLVWLALVNRGFYMRGNPYAGFFYILTAAHAIHVAGGIIALGAVLLRTWHDTNHGPELTYRKNLARSVGWYWHFMGLLWIVLFVMLGFWK